MYYLHKLLHNFYIVTWLVFHEQPCSTTHRIYFILWRGLQGWDIDQIMCMILCENSRKRDFESERNVLQTSRTRRNTFSSFLPMHFLHFEKDIPWSYAWHVPFNLDAHFDWWPNLGWITLPALGRELKKIHPSLNSKRTHPMRGCCADSRPDFPSAWWKDSEERLLQ